MDNMHKKIIKIISGYKTIACLALALALFAPLAASCKEEPETPPATTTQAAVVDNSETLYSVLLMENKYTSDLNLDQARDFYAGGSPAPLLARLALNQSYADVKFTADVDKALFGAEDEYADFIMKVLKNASISLNGRFDPAKKSAAADIAISLSGQKLAGAEFLIDRGMSYGVRSAELYPTYLTLDGAEFAKIVGDASHNAPIGQMTYGGAAALAGKILDLSRIAEIGRDRSKAIIKPFIEKSRGALAAENVTIESNAKIDGASADFTKITVSLADDDLRQLLTALAQAAKENSALSEYLSEKYVAISDLAGELAELGLDEGRFFGRLPPAENIEGLIKSTFAAFESMLNSAEGLPVSGARLELYLDGATVRCVYIGVWTALPESGDLGSAGEPDYSVWFKSLEEPDGLRIDSFAARYAIGGGEYNEVSLRSDLQADKAGGSSALNVCFSGPAFYNALPNFLIKFFWDEGAKKLSLAAYLPESAEKAKALASFDCELLGGDGGAEYIFDMNLKINDPYALPAGFQAQAPTAATGGAAGPLLESALGDRSAYAVSIECGGTLSFGPVQIPTFEGEDTYPLIQDSFYDGTFETVFNVFFANLIRFASANRQLLSLYGFPGF